MADLPEELSESPTVRAIYANYASRQETNRRYIGASVIGKPCHRKLWYDFRWCGREEFEGRMVRLFETGHLEEFRIIANLRAIGCEVHEVDPATKQQFAIVALGGHFRGHLDGAVLGLPEAPKTWHVLEGKTHSHKYFVAVRNSGVQKNKPEHYAQMQVYMHYTGMDRALYFAVNKNDDEIYTERVKYDKAFALQIIADAERIIRATEPPARISEKPDKFPCSFCTHKDRCHGTGGEVAVPVYVNCRNCCHATPIITEGDDAGPWRCEKHGKTLSEQEQLAGCEDHIFIPGLVTFADAIDGSDCSVTYRNKAGEKEVWTNGRMKGQYTSKELIESPMGSVGNATVQAVKLTMGGKIVPEYTNKENWKL